MRSFADSTGNGIGDLPGITERLDYIRWLGVDAVWITPFYPSPGHDHGYDVSDYCDVAPQHGTLADFDQLVERAHNLGLRVLIDVVPNHTSIEHAWFGASRSSRDAPQRSRYVWADPAPDGGPPNNWISHFGGPAWTLDEATGQYWCHLFLPEQPDLNWRDPEVRRHFEDVLRFWIDRGVDGFRIDVAHALIKDAQLRDNPQIAPVAEGMDPLSAFRAFEHRYDLDQSETIDIYRRWHEICAAHGVILLGEVNLASPAHFKRYLEPGVLDNAFFLTPVWMDWQPAELLRILRDMHQAAPQSVSWVISNHDRSRVASRYGGGQIGARRALAVSTLLMALGGLPFIYQGEELSLDDGILHGLHDPISVRNAGAIGRDGCRTPMPWNMKANNGFSTGQPWISADLRPPEHTVRGQRDEPSSALYQYRELIARRAQHPDFWQAPARWLDTGDPLVAAVVRGSAAAVTNLSEQPTQVDLPGYGWRELFTSIRDDSISLRPRNSGTVSPDGPDNAERTTCVSLPPESSILVVQEPQPS